MTDEAIFCLQLFKFWELRKNGEPLSVRLREQRVLAALAVLGPAQRRHLAAVLWPQCPQARAAESLRVSLHHIAHQCPLLVAVGRTALSLGDGVDVDLHNVRAAVAGVHTGAPGPYRVATLLRLDCGELLPGWDEDWVEAEKSYLRPRRIAALELLGAEFLRREDYGQAVRAFSAVLELEPYLESAVDLLVRTHLAAGNQVVAMRELSGFTALLAEELGVQPSATLQGLMGRTLPA
ncbi:MAG: BTAD domain-containing putative transcriptional regulator [Specibacter sp.]